MPHNDTEKNLSEFQSPAESSNHYDKLNLILTERKASELVLDDVWMRKIWLWADSCDIPDDVIPQDKKTLLALKSIVLEAQNVTKLPESIGQLETIPNSV